MRAVRSATTFMSLGMRPSADRPAAEFALALQPITARILASRARTIRPDRGVRLVLARQSDRTANFTLRGTITSRTRSCSIARMTREKLGNAKRDFDEDVAVRHCDSRGIISRR